jgi:hypothetical protein
VIVMLIIKQNILISDQFVVFLSVYIPNVLVVEFKAIPKYHGVRRIPALDHRPVW